MRLRRAVLILSPLPPVRSLEVRIKLIQMARFTKVAYVNTQVGSEESVVSRHYVSITDG